MPVSGKSKTSNMCNISCVSSARWKLCRSVPRQGPVLASSLPSQALAIKSALLRHLLAQTYEDYHVCICCWDGKATTSSDGVSDLVWFRVYGLGSAGCYLPMLIGECACTWVSVPESCRWSADRAIIHVNATSDSIMYRHSCTC